MSTKFVTVTPSGLRVAYSDSNLRSTAANKRPVIILIPGIGDLRSQYRFLAPRLEKRHRVITIDLRGLGESDVGFESYSASSIGSDILKIIHQEGITEEQGVILVGNSMGAAASEWFVGNNTFYIALYFFIEF
jgi:pimeloyl-ACP methyl ester carboxylesterase